MELVQLSQPIIKGQPIPTFVAETINKIRIIFAVGMNFKKWQFCDLEVCVSDDRKVKLCCLL